MKTFLAWCCVAVALGMLLLLISSAKESKIKSSGFWDFMCCWICDSSEVLAIMFIGILGAVILFLQARR